MRYVCPIRKQEPEANVPPNTSPSLLCAATAVLKNGELLSRIPVCTHLMRIRRSHFGHWVNLQNCFHTFKGKGYFFF